MKKSNRGRQCPKGSSCPSRSTPAPRSTPTLASISQMLQKTTINGPLPGELHKDVEHCNQKSSSEPPELPSVTGLNSKSDVLVLGRYTPTCGLLSSRSVFDNNNFCGVDLGVVRKVEEQQSNIDVNVKFTNLQLNPDCFDSSSVIETQSSLEMFEHSEVCPPAAGNLVVVSLSVTDTSRQLYLQPMQPEFNVHPSSFGRTLCLIRTRCKPARSPLRQCTRKLKYARFGYRRQIAGTNCSVPMISVQNQPPVQTQVINVFDFSTPSPDDIVKESQQKAGFCR